MSFSTDRLGSQSSRSTTAALHAHTGVTFRHADVAMVKVADCLYMTAGVRAARRSKFWLDHTCTELRDVIDGALFPPLARYKIDGLNPPSFIDDRR